MSYPKKLCGGVLGDYYAKVLNTLLYNIDVNDHINTYKGEHHIWYAEPEFTGKYIDLCIKIYEQTKNPSALENAKKIVESIMLNMRQDGYIGTLENGNEFENFSVWNQTFTIFGMLSYYRVTNNKRVLDACEKCIRFIMDYFTEKNNDILNSINDGTQHVSILFILADMYRYTNNKLYIDYITYIFNQFKHSDLNFFEFDSILDLKSRKGIEIFVILLGILKYAEIANDTSAIESVKKYWQEINDTQIRNTGNGTIAENWTPNGNAPAMLDKSHSPNETCVAVGWIELSLYLFKITKDVRYINALDKTLYNHILASISKDGTDFAYYQPNHGQKIRTTGPESYKCCRYRGFTLFTYMPDMLFLDESDLLIPMIFTDCEYKSETIAITEKTNYPFESDILFEIDVFENKALKIRIPENYKIANIYLNNSIINPAINEGYINLDLIADKHYTIKLSLIPKLIVETGIIDNENVAALSYGQILLAMKDDNNNNKINISNIELEQLKNNNMGYLVFKGTGFTDGAETDIVFTDYASADNYKVWIPVI